MSYWVEGDARWEQLGPLAKMAPAGTYIFLTNEEERCVLFDRQLPSEKLVMQDGPTTEAMAEANAFWAAGERYRNLGLPQKRGILLDGPPGTGKSVAARLIAHRCLALGGLVSVGNGFKGIADFLQAYARTEKPRPITVVLEDIEQHFPRCEEQVLDLLDGEKAVPDGTLFLATTNKLDQVPERVRNRRSRIDRVIRFGPPSRVDRECYCFELLGCTSIDPAKVAMIAELTDGLTMADLKEVVIQVQIHGRPVRDAVEHVKHCP